MRMSEDERIAKAKAAMEAKQQNRQYMLVWRGSGASQVTTGLNALHDIADMFDILPHSLYNYMCRGGGEYTRRAVNPLTGEWDIVTVKRYDPDVKPKRPRGRPRKFIDWERLGSEAPDYAKAGYTQEPEFFPRKRKPK